MRGGMTCIHDTSVGRQVREGLTSMGVTHKGWGCNILIMVIGGDKQGQEGKAKNEGLVQPEPTHGQSTMAAKLSVCSWF